MKLAIAITGLLAAVSVRAQQPELYDFRQYETVRSRFDVTPSSERLANPGQSAIDLGVSYSLPLSRRSALFGSVGLPGEPALGPPPSYLRRFADTDNPQAPLLHDWVDFQGAISQVFTLGYRWRNVQLEGSAFSGRPQDEKRVTTESLKLDSRSGRLSISPAPNLSLQFSRGTISNLDQLEPNGEVRRTTLSATYKRPFKKGDWQTTLAWGRNARKYRESTYGYLLESTLRVANAHAFFGRVEQVGSDDILRENDSISRQMFKMNKLTVGYVHDLRAGRYPGMDVGVLMSRHYVPSTMVATYGNDPVSYMMFVRLKLK
jgi:hypothetical protein